MKDFWAFLNNLIDKFDIKKLMLCVFLILTLMLVPKINFLKFLMPLDNMEKWIKFVFALISAYILISILDFLRVCLKKYSKHKPKQLFRMMSKYGRYINLYYSDEINEFSMNPIDLYRYSISTDVINKLCENNIIEKQDSTWYGGVLYKLTKRARKKLTRIKKIVLFIDSKIINRNKLKEKE